jgi:hypothetical protein
MTKWYCPKGQKADGSLCSLFGFCHKSQTSICEVPDREKRIKMVYLMLDPAQKRAVNAIAKL